MQRFATQTVVVTDGGGIGGATSRRLARDGARHGITVNGVCPGPTDTALFADYREGAGNPEKLMEAFTRSIPLGRIGQPDDLPGAIPCSSPATMRPTSPGRCSACPAASR